MIDKPKSKYGTRKNFSTIGSGTSQKKKRKKSIEQEDRFGDRGDYSDGLRVPMSGGGEHDGDALWKGYMLECKRTDSKSYRISFGEIEKSYIEAVKADMDWAFAVDLDGITDSTLPKWFVAVETERYDQLFDVPVMETWRHTNKGFGITVNRVDTMLIDAIDNGIDTDIFSFRVIYENYVDEIPPSDITVVDEPSFVEAVRANDD